MHKIRNNKFPNSILNMFDLKTNLRYNLRRNNRDFILDKPNTNFMKKSISYAAPSTWNNLSSEVKGAGNSSQKFKSILDHYSSERYTFSSHFEGGGGAILFQIFCNPMHVLFRIILSSYVVFMYVYTSTFK